MSLTDFQTFNMTFSNRDCLSSSHSFALFGASPIFSQCSLAEFPNSWRIHQHCCYIHHPHKDPRLHLLPPLHWIPGWWLNQPIWKDMIVKLDHLPQNRGKNQKYLKPTPRFWLCVFLLGRGAPQQDRTRSQTAAHLAVWGSVKRSAWSIKVSRGYSNRWGKCCFFS